MIILYITSCLYRGKNQLFSHASGKKHKELASMLLKEQAKLSFTSAADRTNQIMQPINKSCQTTNKEDMTHEGRVAEAEMIWTQQAAACGYSPASCDEMGKLFTAMFPDSKIAQSFGQAKGAHGICHGLGPEKNEEKKKDEAKQLKERTTRQKRKASESSDNLLSKPIKLEEKPLLMN